MVWGGVTPVAQPAVVGGSAPVVLPLIIPIPQERPYTRGRVASLHTPLVTAYGEEPVKTVYVKLAFDAVMVRNDGLTEQSILAAYKRQHQATVVTE